MRQTLPHTATAAKAGIQNNLGLQKVYTTACTVCNNIGTMFR